MSDIRSYTVQLGCGGDVTLFIAEDEGSLFFRLTNSGDTPLDFDAILFDFNDPALLDGLNIFQPVNNFPITGFQAGDGAVDTLSNGAQVLDSYDIGVQFGQVADSPDGDVNEVAFTLWSDTPLSLDDLDLGKLAAVIDSDGGKGYVLTGGTDTKGAVIEEVVVDFESFDGLCYATQSSVVAYNQGWDVRNGRLETDGGDDGVLKLAEIATNSGAELRFDISARDTSLFENSGSYQDSLRIEVRIDGGEWKLLDEFRINDEGTQFVGSETGKTFGTEMKELTYKGGVLDDVDETAQFRLVSDISASDEDIYVDNVELIGRIDISNPPPKVIQEEDFDHLWDPADSSEIVYDSGWDVKYGKLATDGCNDGSLIFDEVAADGPVTLSFDAMARDTSLFENAGCYADGLGLWAKIDGGEWQLLDHFQVNDAGTKMVGSETGKTFSETETTLEYSGGVLDKVTSSVKFAFVSNISASDEDIYIDNFEVTVAPEADCTDAPCAYDLATGLPLIDKDDAALDDEKDALAEDILDELIV